MVTVAVVASLQPVACQLGDVRRPHLRGHASAGEDREATRPGTRRRSWPPPFYGLSDARLRIVYLAGSGLKPRHPDRSFQSAATAARAPARRGVRRRRPRRAPHDVALLRRPGARCRRARPSRRKRPIGERRAPSGLQASACAQSGCRSSVRTSRQVARVPDLDDAVAGRRGEARAVRRVGDAQDGARCAPRMAATCVPPWAVRVHVRIVLSAPAARQRVAALGWKSTVDTGSVGVGQRVEPPARPHVPDLDRSIARSRRRPTCHRG